MSEEMQEVRGIAVVTQEILFYKTMAGEAIIEIGSRLIEAKEMLSHGEWLDWLRDSVDFSERSAQNFMRISREYQNRNTVADLGVRKALSLLSLPPLEREQFMSETHEVDGEEKDVISMTAKELEDAVRERDAAVKEAGSARQDLDRMKAELDEARKKSSELEAALRELKSRPVEVAVAAPGEEEMEKLRREAEAEAKKKAEETLKKKLEAAKKAEEKAAEKVSAAERAANAAKVEAEAQVRAANKEKEILSSQLDEMRKKLAVASSSEMTVFKLHFEQAQTDVNKMLECINKMRDGGAGADADKLSAALRAFCEATVKGLGA